MNPITSAKWAAPELRRECQSVLASNTPPASSQTTGQLLDQLDKNLSALSNSVDELTARLEPVTLPRHETVGGGGTPDAPLSPLNAQILTFNARLQYSIAAINALKNSIQL